ncbi:Ig-like domain-containing protein [Clostridiisalibacter paucivorans]|uniref:Ig-like domain-containing protein n=1 Tax=Clostridiisalibacter paucivorans TaxID=408753 RepID=UPI000479A6B5|nr:Ig-like domain-containing protein [Clostridiisalibacter paucivorans]
MLNPLKTQFLYHLKKFGYTATLNGVEDIRIFTKEYNDAVSTKDHKYLFTEKGKVKQGDYINLLGLDYLVIHEDESTNNVYTKFIVRRIKYIVKFIIDREVHFIPVVINEGIQDIESNQYFQTGKGELVLLLKEDTTTSKINVKDRFIKMNSAWAITNITSTEKGILKIYATMDTFNADDDKELEIADRWKFEDTYTIAISNQVGTITTDDTVQLDIVAKKNDIVVENPTLTFTSSDDTVVTVDANGLVTPIRAGTVDITVNYQNVSDTITINIEEAIVNNYTIQLENSLNDPRVIIDYENTFTAKVYNNDTLVDEPVDFAITGDTDNLEIISQTDKDITLKGLDFGNITLTVTLRSDNTVSISKDMPIEYIY